MTEHEHFHLTDGRIDTIRLIFDATAWHRRAGRHPVSTPKPGIVRSNGPAGGKPSA
ncbi:hypothetical protein [Streptomyces sp. NPDC056796]|uniref:hypothetical protein n=1 Tax=Streptomyces sp. NPDC056796 TaxID=3345947 RepID=UPI00369FFE1C